MRSHASRTGGPSEQAPTAPSIPSWLSKLPFEVSGYSCANPHALISPQAQPNTTSRPTRMRAVSARSSRAVDARTASQPVVTFLREGQGGAAPSTRESVARSEAWDDGDTVGQGSSISQRSSKRQTSTVHQTHQAPMFYQNTLMQQMPTIPQFSGANGQAPVVNNFHCSYSPVDSRQNITTNNQQYRTDNSYRQIINALHKVHTNDNQRQIAMHVGKYDSVCYTGYGMDIVLQPPCIPSEIMIFTI